MWYEKTCDIKEYEEAFRIYIKECLKRNNTENVIEKRQEELTEVAC